MIIIKNKKILRSLSKKYNFEFCPIYKYVVFSENYFLKFQHKNKKYKLKFFDGCFNPYLVQY